MEVCTHHCIGAVLTMHEDRDEDEQKLRGLDFQHAALKSSGGRSIQILHLANVSATHYENIPPQLKVLHERSITRK